MKKETSERRATLHPIQLVNLGVKELFLRSNRPPEVSVGPEPEHCSINVSSSSYDSELKRIAVSLKLESGIGADQTKAPYAMKIELVGIFEVDEAGFSVEHISSWAMNNAPLIMFPYLREHAYSLSSRCGFRPLLLPLLEVPTFKLEKTATKKKKLN
jgi:preprotein translocase subunit SecB